MNLVFVVQEKNIKIVVVLYKIIINEIKTTNNINAGNNNFFIF